MVTKRITPRGIRNNNPCNIKYNSANNWVGQRDPNGEFCTFVDARYGLRAAYITIGNYYKKGYRTIAEIIGRWAPDGAQIVSNYSYFVARGCGALSTEEIAIDDEDFMVKFLKGMVKFENGYNPYDCKTYSSAYKLSNIAKFAKL